MKRIGIILILILGNLVCLHAQNENWKKHVGALSPEQIQKIEASFVKGLPPILNTRKLTEKESLQAYMSFRKIKNYAPYAFYDLYSNNFIDVRSNYNNQSVYGNILDSISDKAMRAVVVKDLLAFEHNLVDHLDSVNLIRLELAQIKDPISEAVALIKYAHIYYTYAGNSQYYPAHLYDKVQARENYALAFKLMRDKNIDPGSEIEAIYVNEYYRACEDLYKTDEEKYYEQFLQDYLDIVQTCDNLLIPYYNVPDSLKNDPSNSQYRQYQSYNYYTNHDVDGVKALFKNSGASERLNDYYLDQLNSHRKDNDYLNKAIYILLENGCANTEAFFSYCEASYAMEPSYLNCFGSALASKKYNMRSEMIQYFQEAYKLAENDLQRGTMAYQIGMAMNVPRPVDPSTNKNYAKGTPEYIEWENNMMLAAANLKQVLALQDAFSSSSSIDVRKYPADAAYALAQNLYRLVSSAMSVEVCDEAIQYAQMAMAAAPDKYNANAESLVANITNARQQIANLNREQKAYERRKKEYEAYMKKKKAEEDFWNQK